MTETSASTEDAAAARSAELLRLRKERREAKMKANGASRLDQVMGLSGGPRKEPPSAPAPSGISTDTSTPILSTSKPAPARQSHTDPPEVDISVAPHFYTPQDTQRVPRPSAPSPVPGPNMPEAQVRQILGLDQPDAGPNPGDDPMLSMLRSILGGPNGVNPGGMPGAGGFPFPSGTGPGPGLNTFANPAGPPSTTPTATTAVLPDQYASLWRLLHTIVALGLGLYISLWTSFSGTKTERDLQRRAHNEAEAAESARRFFYAFATTEAVLLTTRYFMDRGRASATGSGMLGTLVGFLPPPFKGYVEIGIRYAQIFGTVRNDVLVCIFVLGVCSWVRS